MFLIDFSKGKVEKELGCFHDPIGVICKKTGYNHER